MSRRGGGSLCVDLFDWHQDFFDCFTFCLNSHRFAKEKMKNVLATLSVVIVICFGHSLAFAVDSQSAALGPILDELKNSAAPDDYQQIADAISSSEILQQELRELVATKRFTGFSISPRAQLTDGRAGVFGAFTLGSKIVCATEYLRELKKNRLFDVAYPDDILPDNTVFVLAHLVYHIRNPLDPRNYSSPGEFSRAAIKIEASAFIEAWNATLKVAERMNAGRQLSAKQVGQLLMNTRYRFALIGAMSHKIDPLKFSPSGLVAANDMNIQAVAAALKNSRHADLE